MDQIKAAAINIEGYPHYTEHLAPYCDILQIPILFSEEESAILAKKTYPSLDVHYIPYEKFTPQLLAEKVDVLFSSGEADFDLFISPFSPFNSQIRQVHCPHGFSDKAFWLTRSALADITLVYGQHMLDMISQSEYSSAFGRYVLTGNVRYHYYLKFQSFFDKLVRKQCIFQKNQTTLLYAPTWNDEEESSTFFDASQILIDRLPDTYNLIVKLHPHLKLNNIAEVYHIIAKYEEKPNVLFLDDYPLVFPLLNIVDIYIGDLSSISYDFLYFDRPLYFLKPNDTVSAYVYRTGVTIEPEDIPQLFTIIYDTIEKDHQFSAIRKEVLTYTFDPKASPDSIREELKKFLS